MRASSPKSPTEACVRAFVDDEPLEHARRAQVDVRRIPAAATDDAPHVVVFDVIYGEAHDCPSGCFSSHAIGIAVSCARLGWLSVHDYEKTPKNELHAFHLEATDALLFDEALWDADRAFASRVLVPWLANDPATPSEARARAQRWLAQR